MGAQVLVADDDRAIRESLARALELEGYTVTTASDGATALAAVHETAPEAMVLDVMMPNVDGLTAVPGAAGRARSHADPDADRPHHEVRACRWARCRCGRLPGQTLRAGRAELTALVNELVALATDQAAVAPVCASAVRCVVDASGRFDGYRAPMVNVKDIIAKSVTKAHEAAFTASKGRLGGKVAGMPAVMLTTTGRKSGKKRTTMLTTPLQEGDKVVLIASYGGDDRHPTWYLNLRDDPDVEIMMGGSNRTMRARTASADEKAEMWPKITSKYKGYAGYQRKTERDIPVVILEPR